MSALKPKFPAASAFQAELELRVDAYFAERGLSQRDSGRMVLKTSLLLLWAAGSYLGLLFASTGWVAAPLVLSIGLAAAGIGFNVQHDANHAAYSRHRLVNRLLSLSLDLLGGSSYVWRWKHNVIHHTYSNIAGADDDIEVRPLARMAPSQPWHAAHRLQHIYLWILYGFLAIKWHVLDDFRQVLTGRISGHRFPRPRGRDALVFVGGKVLFVVLIFGLPLRLHPVWAVLLAYAGGAFVLGLTMSIVFQLAHCVEEAAFPLPLAGARMGHEWAVHQVATSVDFARESRATSWYVGGLNFQIEHHLFPRICHVHYPALAPIVEAVCARHGVPYRTNRSLRSAIGSHLRWLRRMGDGETTRFLAPDVRP